MIEQVISGGQTGADKAGLTAAFDLGFPTGGTAPKGYRICLPDGTDGTDPELGTKYGLVEHEQFDYPPRTIKNVKDSDGTLWVGFEGSSGGKLTINTCIEFGKPYIINPTASRLKEWIEDNSIKILNVSGNRESDFNPGIFQTTYDLVYEALK